MPWQVLRLPFAALSLLVLVLPLLWSAPAAAKYASFVIDADSGRILHSVNADTRNYPASLTKMMTLYLVFEAIEDGRLTLKTPLKVSRRATRQPPSKLALPAGSTIRVEQAIMALVTKSANDVAVVVAESLAQSERDFALKMTAKARQLGMNRTTFRNASGLPNRSQMSTARDMATLAKALMRDYPQYYGYFSRETFSYKGYTFRNHNKLLAKYNGTDGIKTGYTHASGFNLVSSVKRGNHHLIGVVFGGKTGRSRDRHMVKLLDKAFDELGTSGLLMAGEIPPPPTKPDLESEIEVAAATPPTAEGDASGDLDGEWGIQVGVYATRTPAGEMARKAVEAAPDLLVTGVIKVVPLNRHRGKTWYRARILGLEKREAYQACRELKRQKISCMELRTKNLQVANAAR